MQNGMDRRLPDDSIRAYADGQGWRQLKEQGFTYYGVLEGLGRLGLHIPIDDSPSVLRGAATFRKLLQGHHAKQAV